ncbi:MAG: CCA tRNA nucleotidyltransferase [Deltaproteobacteria bacterium]|nr:CCA tRNA nucleotidyltransferase [Deltaproteobacteria bacterium]
MQIEAPPAVLALCDALRAHGHEAVLVGGGVRDALLARPVRDWDVATSAPVDALLALFPRAIPVGASARHGTALVPTPAGPVDVTTYRGTDLAADLARRDFTVNAMAFDPHAQRLIDPHGGRAHLAARQLRAVGSAAARFEEDPLRALRAARLLAELGLTPDAEIEAAMRASVPSLERVAPERLRSELTRALVGAHARAAFELLRRTGIEAALVPGARDDAPAVIGAMPADLTLRLAAWLRGAVRGRVLARLRFGRASARRIDRLLSLHPLDAGFDGSEASARKIRQRCGDAETVAALLALRSAECAIEQNVWWDAKLAALRAGFAAAERAPFGPADLALRGDEVMAALGCGPGPRVGAALKHLVAHVVADPSANTPERLRELIAAWLEAPGGQRNAGV